MACHCPSKTPYHLSLERIQVVVYAQKSEPGNVQRSLREFQSFAATTQMIYHNWSPPPYSDKLVKQYEDLYGSVFSKPIPAIYKERSCTDCARTLRPRPVSKKLWWTQSFGVAWCQEHVTLAAKEAVYFNWMEYKFLLVLHQLNPELLLGME